MGACSAVYSKDILQSGGERSFVTLESNSIVYYKRDAVPRFYEISSLIKRALSSNAGTKSDQEEGDLEEGFSELESSKSGQDTSSDDSEDDELTPEGKLSADEDESDDEQLELDLIETENSRKTVENKPSELFKTIVSAAGLSVGSALDKWVEEGNEISRVEVAKAMLQLRRRRMYGRALQVILLNYLTL